MAVQPSTFRSSNLYRATFSLQYNYVCLCTIRLGPRYLAFSHSLSLEQIGCGVKGNTMHHSSNVVPTTQIFYVVFSHMHQHSARKHLCVIQLFGFFSLSLAVTTTAASIQRRSDCNQRPAVYRISYHAHFNPERILMDYACNADEIQESYAFTVLKGDIFQC